VRVSAMGPEEVIKWGRRLIYVVLFIALVIVYGSFHLPYTYTFLGAVLCLVFTLLFFLKEENWTEEGEAEVYTCIYRPF
jgi:hypothetical protein